MRLFFCPIFKAAIKERKDIVLWLLSRIYMAAHDASINLSQHIVVFKLTPAPANGATRDGSGEKRQII